METDIISHTTTNNFTTAAYEMKIDLFQAQTRQFYKNIFSTKHQASQAYP